jgi:hypothetical protein
VRWTEERLDNCFDEEVVWRQPRDLRDKRRTMLGKLQGLMTSGETELVGGELHFGGSRNTFSVAVSATEKIEAVLGRAFMAGTGVCSGGSTQKCRCRTLWPAKHQC